MPGDIMIKIAFASASRTHVDLHFGASDSLVIFDVSPGEAYLLGVGQFIRAEMKGENKDRGQSGFDTGPFQTADASAPPLLAVPEMDPEDKVIAKLEFLTGCAAVYAASIGSSSIKRLMALGVQPIIVGHGHSIEDLLNEVSLALVHSGLSWVTRAAAKADQSQFVVVASSRQATSKTPEIRQLITTIDDLD
jgi:nitrogen fixation protein NifX